MKTAVLVKNGELSGYPGDLLIDGETVKSYNLSFECEIRKIDILMGKNLPCALIKELRDKGVLFLKLSALEETESLDLDIIIPEEFRHKRGWGCSKGFEV